MHGNLEPEERVWGEVGITTMFNPDGTYDIDYDEDPVVYDEYTDPYGGR